MEFFKAFRINKTDKLIIQSIIRTSLFGLNDKGDGAGGRERERESGVESRERQSNYTHGYKHGHKHA